MHVYYKPENGAILYTMEKVADNVPVPPGDYIVVPEGTNISPLGAYRVENGQLVTHDITAAAQQATVKVNSKVGAVRERYITVAPGQEMIYLGKEAEAKRLLAPYSDLPPWQYAGWEQEYPFIAKEVGVTAPNPREVAETFLTLAAQWRAVGSDLEALRVSTNRALETAATPDEIDTIMQAFNAALEAV